MSFIYFIIQNLKKYLFLNKVNLFNFYKIRKFIMNISHLIFRNRYSAFIKVSLLLDITLNLDFLFPKLLKLYLLLLLKILVFNNLNLFLIYQFFQKIYCLG